MKIMAKICSYPGCNYGVFSKGLCNSHWRREYGKPIALKKTEKDYQVYSKKGSALDDRKAMAAFFEDQIPRIPRCCENCGRPFGFIPQYRLKWVMAHILPKSDFESVKLNPENLLFLCTYDHCHDLWDKRGKADRQKMNCYPLATERVAGFYHLLTGHEQNRLERYL